MAKSTQSKYKCFNCGKEYVESNYYKSNSEFYVNMGKIPYCKQCVGKLYQYFLERYTNEGCLNPEKKAVRRLCMAFDIYFNEKFYNDAINDAKRRKMDITALAAYIKIVQLKQGKDKTYDDTVYEEEQAGVANAFVDIAMEQETEVDKAIIQFFGDGFSPEDYKFLKREYADWTARHECKTKAQEEVFKDICFNRLQNLKALRRGEDTKDITASFQKMLDSGKLQPKQNAGDTTADNQTFGTLIDKWENERPLPEIDAELKDVDKIGYYVDTFFRGHTCRMLNVKNAFSNLYSSMMKKFTVSKPEYNQDEDDYDSELNFDAIFGDQSSDLPDE